MGNTMSFKRQLVTYVALIVMALTAIGFGVVNAHTLHLRLSQVQADRAHREIRAEQACSSCHKSKHKAPLVGECENCHVTSTWQSASYKHEPAYLNRDAHATAPCYRCHPKGATIKRATCNTCHKSSGHRIDLWCQMCHETSSWTKSHELPRTHVRVSGSHESKATCPDCHSIHDVKTTWYCVDCHPKKKHDQIIATDPHKRAQCVDCHTRRNGVDNLNKATIKASDCGACHRPPHQRLERCKRCHSIRSFKQVHYAHTSWPLMGAHRKTACRKCHAVKKLGVAAGRACASCHRPPHGSIGPCDQCHTQTRFAPSTFRHSNVYVLKGAHTRLSCAKCHRNGQWNSAKAKPCASCHRAPHGAIGPCDRCHTQTSFVPSTFRHSTAYALTGAHRKLACAKCHPKKRWASAKGTACVSCHKVRHGGWSECARCHTTTAWQPIRAITHTSKYPLIGQHRYVECIGCHKGLLFNNTPTRCVSCHASLSHGMSNCETCHTPASWSAVTNHGG